MTEQYLEELIGKYAAGTASDEDIKKLMHWYQSTRIDKVQWTSSNPAEKQDVYDRMLDRLRKEISPKRARVINFSWLRVAAMLLVFIGAAAIGVYYLKPTTQSYITITNPSGKIQLVSLPDSSKVWLNASTTLRYLKSFKENRAIDLDGEAYFEVTHDQQHPFHVKAGGIQTTVLGTTFNIKAYRSGAITSVSVITGKVKVADSSKGLAVLTPFLQLQFDRKTREAKTTTIDTGAVLAWKKGRLQFQGETLADIAGALENWYGVKIIFTNPAMRNCRYYMSFDNTISLEKILSTMSEITAMKYAVDENTRTVTLSGKECN